MSNTILPKGGSASGRESHFSTIQVETEVCEEIEAADEIDFLRRDVAPAAEGASLAILRTAAGRVGWVPPRAIRNEKMMPIIKEFLG